MDSLWTKTARLPHFPPLEGDRETDVLIIGGGMAGILCAWFLNQAGVDCILLEAAELCGGTTGNTTAKITAQHGLLYDRLIRTLDQKKASLYLRANQAALEQYRRLCRDIDCDFQTRDSFVFSLDRRDKLERETLALTTLGVSAELVTQLPLPFPTAGAVRFPRQAQFHPLKFAAALVQGLRIHEHTKVLELRPGAVRTHQGTVQANKIIVTTHFPLLNKHGGYFIKLYQHRSCVLALEGGPVMEGMYVDEAEGGLSFRSSGNLLLLGGGGHRTGKRGGGWNELSACARKYYPDAREIFRWATQDCMTLDGLPYVGPYSSGTPNLYTATGFNKWGMTSSMAAAMLLSDLVQDKENPYAELFSPARTSLRPQLAANLLKSAAGLLTPTTPRCPHMGCALKYNPQERSWDCPCHGSRFGEDGRLLDNPATDDLRKKPASPQ
ncbi:FAD-dependent oxidoreductase [Oscillospiraceae bacterium 44-34]